VAEDNESPLGGPLELPGGVPPIKRSSYKLPTGHGRRKKLVIGLVIVVLGGLGFGGWKVLQKHSQSQTTTNKQPAETKQATTKSSDVPTTSELKSFKSIDLGLELAYPNTWTVNETAGGVRLTSPDFSYPTTNKGNADGNFRVYIRKGARGIDSTYIGRGVAIKPSEKLIYDQPAADQRKDTLVSFFGLDTPDYFAYFFVAGNFELKPGDTLGPDYGKEPETFIVAGGYSATSMTDDLETNKVPLGTFVQTNAYKQAIGIIKSLKLQ